MSDQEVTAIHSEAVIKDREAKKTVVVETISAHCVDSSPFEDLRLIGEALQGGDKLVAKILTGGWCNFSYCVYLEGNPERKVYAKLAFSRALWNPDPDAHYDLKRIDNEFHMMEIYHGINPGSVAIPYLCLDVDNMKLLVTQWSPADEQFANQFIDGVVDLRIIPKLAQGLAKLNSVKEFEPDYGCQVKEALKGFYAGQTSLIQSLFDPEKDPMDRVSKSAKELGLEEWLHIDAEFLANLFKTDSLAHSDTHVFNILVEKKPDVSTLEHFGPKGSFAICDWEMTMACSLGRDVGLFYAFPMACLIAHAINGNKQFALDILNCLGLLWTEYASDLMQTGEKSEEDLRNAYHTVMGQAGSFLFSVYYFRAIQMEYLPLEGNKLMTARESLGYLGLYCMNLGFGKEYEKCDLDELRSMFTNEVYKEIERSAPTRPSRLFMRSSMLRESGRRVSDAGVFASIISSLDIEEN